MTLHDPDPERRAALVERLRALIPASALPPGSPVLPLGLAPVDACLPGGGLARGAVHEIAPAVPDDAAAAFGFTIALAARALAAQPGPLLLVLARRALAPVGEPYGHGLAGLGLDPERLLLVEVETDLDALWAVEEVLRSGVPSAVVGWLDGALPLKASRRLQLAGQASGALALLLRPAQADAPNAAPTRWRVGAAPAGRDRFDLTARWRWRLTLERCRNGRPGTWIVEWDHAAHRFDQVGTLADHTLPRSAGAG